MSASQDAQAARPLAIGLLAAGFSAVLSLFALQLMLISLRTAIGEELQRGSPNELAHFVKFERVLLPWPQDGSADCVGSLIRALRHPVDGPPDRLPEEAAAALATPICRGEMVSMAPNRTADGQYILSVDGGLLVLTSLHPGKMRLLDILTATPSVSLVISAIALLSGALAFLLRLRTHRHFLALNSRASIDDLSGLLRRDEFMRRVAALSGANADGRSIASLLAIDIDHFKSVNDRFGHAAGDEVIRSFGRLITAALRTDDVIGRTGGEEFMVVLRAQPKYLAAEIADRLRKRFSAQAFVFGGETIFVTISIGVATLQQGEPPMSAVNRADRRLYAAKRNGRNCVVWKEEADAIQA